MPTEEKLSQRDILGRQQAKRWKALADRQAGIFLKPEQKKLLEQIDQEYLESDRALYQTEQERERESEPGHKMGPGSYILLLFSFCVDILEIIVTYTGVGAPIAVIVGFAIDIVIFIAVGLSKKAQKQWKRFAIGFVGENFPLFSSLIEIIPVRTLALIWMYRGMSKPPEKEPENKEKEGKTN